MPSLGADMQFGTVVAWNVAPGDTITKGDVVVEVETEKGVFEVECSESGVVDELVVPKGTKVPVGTVIARLRAAAPAPEPPPAPAPSPAERRVPQPAPHLVPPPRHGTRASPLARRIAEAAGIDVATIAGTGPDGAITKDDVERALATTPPTAATASRPSVATPAPSAADAMRQAIAAAMARSKREIPHYYLGTDIDMSAALGWLREENARRPITERLLPAALLLKSVARALTAFPALNGFWTDGAFRAGNGIHLGIAISLRGGGLIAPAIHDADRLSLADLMPALGDLVRRARGGGLRGSEMTDATITVSNLGDEGVQLLFGVIYPPQVALVGFGRVVERPWAERGLLGVRPVVAV
ncbi:MAG: dihydrolipoamide acetyltransferase family protein, partial [Gemmatimonadota bacterium]